MHPTYTYYFTRRGAPKHQAIYYHENSLIEIYRGRDRIDGTSPISFDSRTEFNGWCTQYFSTFV